MRFILLTLFLLTLPAQAAILHVSKTGDGSDGSNWESAFIEIAEAIESATSGDEIRVASGTYFETIEMKMGVDLYGGFVGLDEVDDLATRDFRSYHSIIDATGLGRTAIIGASHTEINGFTICNGRAPVLSPGVGTGGIECLQLEGVVIRNCVISRNEALVTYPDPFTYTGGRGGGIRFESCDAIIDSCAIVSNVALASGGGVFITGSGTYTLRNCLIADNIGGGVIIGGHSVEIIENCTFGNDNTEGVLGNFGRENDLETGQAKVLLVNSIVRYLNGSIDSASYSNLPFEGGFGNIDTNPLWRDPEMGDYRLLPNSPCIDSGTDTALTTDLDGNPRPVDVNGRGIGQGFDMGCYEFQLKRADLDRDGRVDGEDLILFQEEWMRKGE